LIEDILDLASVDCGSSIRGGCVAIGKVGVNGLFEIPFESVDGNDNDDEDEGDEGDVREGEEEKVSKEDITTSHHNETKRNETKEYDEQVNNTQQSLQERRDT